MCIHAKHTIYIRVVRQEEQQHLILLHKRTNERRSFTIASVSIKKYPISGIQCLNRERYSMEIAASFFYFYIHIYKMFCNILSFLILYFHNSLFSIISSTSQKKHFCVNTVLLDLIHIQQQFIHSYLSGHSRCRLKNNNMTSITIPFSVFSTCKLSSSKHCTSPSIQLYPFS